MNSLKNIYKEFVKTGKLEFLLSFKFSQDHLETLFSVIRSRGGFNNNPNCLQFKTAFKRILMRNQLSSSINANCCFDKEQVIHFSNLISQTTDVTAFLNKDSPIGEDEIDEVNTVLLTEYAADIVTYIAGYVERHLIKRIRCEHCLNGISKLNIIDNELIRIKNRGGLTVPRVDIVKICKIAEKELWAFEITKENFYDKLFTKIMRNLTYENLFNSLSHPCNLVDSEHRILLIKTILTCFLKIRLHHISKHHNINKKSTFVRSKLTKLIHFTNQ